MKHILLAFVLLTTTAIAHQGVQNPAVKARMHNMGLIKDQTAILGKMAKGTVAFDADTARAAAAALAGHAEETKALFAAPEDDPKSEAKPSIWTDYSDFVMKADALRSAAEAATEIAGQADLATAVQRIGATCKDCHSAHRE